MNFRKFFFVSACAMVLASPAMAQDTTPVPDHPRVNGVDQRLDNQQNRIDAGTANGSIGSSKRAAADDARDEHVAAEASRDEAAHNGHLTKKENAHLNRQLNRNSRKIHTQRTN